MKYASWLAFFFLPLVTVSQADISIEPPFWWTGMADPHLQLMVKGDDIGGYQANIEDPAVKLQSATCPGSPNYLFLNLFIPKDCPPGSLTISLKNKEGKTLQFEYSLLDRMQGSSERQGFNTSDVVYLVTPDRFVNGSVSNDNITGLADASDRSEPLGRHGGDLEGVIKHLDYISDMGFTALWLNPVQENAMPRHSYHGYAITDFYKIDPRLGTNESYRLLCKQANDHGIKMIMDLVVNHCGLHHPWLKDLPTEDWINYSGQEFQQTNHRKTIPFDPYAAEADKKILYDGWFVRTMPDLNVRNPYLATYLIQNSIWWIEYAGLSGIRMDTYPYPDKEFMRKWSERIMQEYPHLNIVGEVWHDDVLTTAYWQQGKQNTDGYISHLPSLFDFPIHSAMIKSLNAKGGWEDSWMPLYETMAKDAVYANPFNMMVFADNHDMSRIFTQVDEDYDSYMMAMTYILTIRGIPQIFYGTEILMRNPGTDNHGVIRSDFPGGWEGDTINAFTGNGLSIQAAGAQQFLKKLLRWRGGSKTIHYGNTLHFTPANNVYVYFRYDQDQLIMIILNKNESPVTLSLERFREILPKGVIGMNVLTGKETTLEDRFELAGPGPVILEIAR